MAENVCCPLLKVVDCADTEEHKHLYCDSRHTLEESLLDNDCVIVFCLSQFKECKYYPRGEGERRR